MTTDTSDTSDKNSTMETPPKETTDDTVVTDTNTTTRKSTLVKAITTARKSAWSDDSSTDSHLAAEKDDEYPKLATPKATQRTLRSTTEKERTLRIAPTQAAIFLHRILIEWHKRNKNKFKSPPYKQLNGPYTNAINKYEKAGNRQALWEYYTFACTVDKTLEGITQNKKNGRAYVKPNICDNYKEIISTYATTDPATGDKTTPATVPNDPGTTADVIPITMTADMDNPVATTDPPPLNDTPDDAHVETKIVTLLLELRTFQRVTKRREQEL